jgi:hypothetical protein
VDGVDRDMISLICSTAAYGLLRDDLDRAANNANVSTAAAEFGTYHGVRVYSSVYWPAGVRIIGMANGSVAQPVRTSVSDPIKLQQSDAYGFGIFYYFGTKAVMPDLISLVS